MNLSLEIEFLTGVCRAASYEAPGVADWPPQPDRVFSALVATWAARGELEDEREALEWLEKQEPPTVHASKHSARTAPDVYVPPNDKYLGVIPERRSNSRHPRRFPVACPDHPVIELVWPDCPEISMFETLDGIARDLSYLGHSASLVRCRFLQVSGVARRHQDKRQKRCALRRIYPGRLQELEQAHHKNPIRPEICPGEFVPELLQSQSEAPSEWLVLEIIDGLIPDIRASALVCRAIRRVFMSGYRRAGMADKIPCIISGHEPNGKPTRKPHLAIVPMAFAGSPYADGRVFGFSLIPPREVTLSEIPGFREAFAAVTSYDAGQERRVLMLKESSLPGQLQLSPVGSPSKASLSTVPYLKPAFVWASVTPIILDRHLKRHDENEVRELVAAACENVRLPRPGLDQIYVGKHSAVNGMPPSRPSYRAPPWTRWKVPEALSTRSLIHVVINFEQKIRGPVLLGAGRFTGLGLCRRIKAGS